MPRFNELKKVVIFGSGPIVIGQACEFDYSGTQACKALMKENLEVILVNSNPATIMTDPEIATRVYVEPLKIPFVKKILEKERPDAIIPTLGGQTALNLALDLDRAGILQELNIKLLGATPKIIKSAEDRELFCKILDSVNAKYPKSKLVRTFEEGLKVAAELLTYPIILRPNYTLGGGGGGIAYSLEELKDKLAHALHESPTSEVLVEESVAGWKEFELEVMRDANGTFVVICSIENIDPCGVHTGDSITVAPQQTLTDEQYQDMRDEARKIIDAVGLTCGGANIQFVVDPLTGERLVIEMNPRVSRSSALASKATGFPIAKIAALLAVGYSLDEIHNDITKTTLSCYEPALDYVVTKIPRFNFDKFQNLQTSSNLRGDLLTTQMKSIGEVMAIGRNFKESFLKAIRSLEGSFEGFKEVPFSEERLSSPNSQRIFHLIEALRKGWSVESLYKSTQIDPWFLEQFRDYVEMEKNLKNLNSENLLAAKRMGFSDQAIGHCSAKTEEEIRKLRAQWKIRPAFLKVDTCAGEFKSETPYFYSTYWADPTDYPKKDSECGGVAILGSGPNRIGQGIEFDYGCVRGVLAFQKLGYRVLMINSNPETVSTDYDTANELYFEPLTAECTIEICRFAKPQGFVAQFGGQTAIHLAPHLISAGFKMLGSSLETINLAEDRGEFAKVCNELNFAAPKSGMASSFSQGEKIADAVGYPIICRPSYVLGGQRMEIIENRDELQGYFQRHEANISQRSPCLMDQFLDGALEVDVDLVRGPDWLIIGGVVEHIEAAGVHSGDSMGVLPPQRLKPETCKKIEQLSSELAQRMKIVGHLNLQLAVKDDVVYMLEANPRSSRSVPFVAKATRIPLVDLAVQAMAGLTAEKIAPKRYQWKEMKDVCVKGVVFPFNKFPGVDSVLGPEMKSTGETMGRGADYSEALLKAMVASHITLPLKGEVLLSLRDKDKDSLLYLAKELLKLGYSLSATPGTAQFLGDHNLPCIIVRKVHQGRPHCVDRIRSGKVDLVINTTSGRHAREASFSIRRSCIDYRVPCLTESDAADAFLLALKKHHQHDFEVAPL